MKLIGKLKDKVDQAESKEEAKKAIEQAGTESLGQIFFNAGFADVCFLEKAANSQVVLNVEAITRSTGDNTQG